MKSRFAILLASAGLTIAHPGAHQKRHHEHHKRQAPNVQLDYVVKYMLDGQVISPQEVQEGLANGTLIIENGGPVPSPASPVTPTFSYSSSDVPASPVYAASPSSPAAPSSAPAPATTSPAAASPAASPNNAGTSLAGSFGITASNVDVPFPDGSIDCSDFPSAYGALPVDYLNMGGWIGIQTPGSGSSSGGYNSISTATSGSTCTEGAFCSYACPAGYLKSQWPSTQGVSGQSVGGLQCTNGKLTKTNSAFDTICIPGADEVTILIQNKLPSDSVSICRTDYPGTESETVPLGLAAGQTGPLACPNAANYYQWQGKSTSAQYYVNNAGVGVSDACWWNTPASNSGNYAPLNLGVGYSGGSAWLAIFQNAPTTNAQLNFKISIVGDGVSGTCTYSNGQYYANGAANSKGCTVSISSGTATYVLEQDD